MFVTAPLAGFLSESLGHAVRWRLVGRNVAQAVAPPRPEHREMTALDGAGVESLLRAAEGTAYRPLIHLAVYTGLRRSELLALRWKDVDLDMATLSVVQVLHRLKDGWTIYQAPKTAKERRQIALTPVSAVALREHRERQEG